KLKFLALTGVMARDDSDHPSTLTDVWPVVAVRVLTPSLNVAPTGMALIVNVARLLLSPARFLALAPRFNVTGDPSTPLAATGANVGATGLMVTVSLAVAVALRLPCASFSVAAMDSVNSAAFAGVILRLVRVQAAMFVDVLPAVAVKEWPWPSLSTAPTGMALTTTEAQLLASPETLLSAAPRFNVTSDPSTPVAATGANVGASGLTVIASVAVVAVLSCPCESICVAETLRLKFASLRGVMARDDSDHPSTLTDVLPAVAVKVLTPSLSVAPTGMALIVSVARLLLSPARFLALAPRFNAIGDPATPVAAAGANVGATGLMVTVSLAVTVVLRLPCASFSVAAMDSVNSAAFAGVILRPVRVQAAMFVDVLPAVAVKEWPLSSLSTAPTGMALTTTEAQLLASPETLLSAAPRFNAIGDPSTPVSATGAKVGASGLTVIASVAVVAVLSCPCESICVAETLRLKFASLRGVMARDDSDHPSTLTDVLPAVAVKVLTPSLSVVPTGIALIVSVARLLLSPARFLALAPRFNAIGDPSTPVSAHGTNAGARGLIVTVSLAVTVALRLPCASLSVAAMDSVNSAAFA